MLSRSTNSNFLDISIFRWRCVHVPEDCRTERRDGDLHLQVELANEYDVSVCYEKARSDNKAVESPHNVFRLLTPDSLTGASEFLERFGPLKLEPSPTEPRESESPSTVRDLDAQERSEWLFHRTGPMPDIKEAWWVNLDDFHRKRARYVAVAKLWESLFREPSELRKAWLELCADSEKIARSEGIILRFAVVGEDGRDQLKVAFVPGYDTEHLKRWVETAPAKVLQQNAARLIQRELREHAKASMVRWQRIEHGPTFGFYPVLEPKSLWAAIWCFFGYDTFNGVGLRICPNHGKAFYPPRKDRLFCTPEEQQRHSKLTWWNDNKKSQLAQRRKRRRLFAKRKARR